MTVGKHERVSERERERSRQADREYEYLCESKKYKRKFLLGRELGQLTSPD